MKTFLAHRQYKNKPRARFAPQASVFQPLLPSIVYFVILPETPGIRKRKRNLKSYLQGDSKAMKKKFRDPKKLVVQNGP